MYPFASRGRHRPSALALAAATTLAACADDPTAPTARLSGLEPNATVGGVYTVSNTQDNGIGSLRWALSYAIDGEIIRFDPGLAGQTIFVDSAITMHEAVTIEGPAGAGLTINAAGKDRVFEAWGNGPITFRNLSITGGDAGTSGAGAIFGSAAVVIENSAIYGNRASSFAAIVVGEITLINTTVSGNTSTSTQSSSVILGGSTKVLRIVNSTIAHNTSGGIPGGDVVLRNSIIANNSDRNCFGVTTLIVREGNNISDDDTCGAPGEIMIVDPLLAPLADNGGPARTHALPAGSPAINAGTSCSVTVDQRYVPRDAQCDLGAFEFTDPTTVTLTIDPSTAVNQKTGWAILSGTMRCSRAETFSLTLLLQQTQKVKGKATEVHAASTLPVFCDTNVRPWSASMVLTDGAFQNGSATATVETFQTAAWVTPAAASGTVKTYWSRK